MGQLPLATLALCALLTLTCAPYWPTRFVPYAATTRADAVVCVETVLRDQRYRTGERWALFQHDDERFTRWRYNYPDRQRSEPLYLGTWDELTVDALDGHFRINGRGWHWYGNPWKGFHEQQKAPGPAAHRAAAQVEARCG